MFATSVAPGGLPPLAVSFFPSLAPEYGWLAAALAVLLALPLLAELLGLRFVPRGRMGIVVKRWSSRGSSGASHRIALDGEAGVLPEVLRPGFHLGLWRWQYRVHLMPVVEIRPGKIGYVYAREGEPLPPGQVLGRAVDCDNFQDARRFLAGGQRGRQRVVLREGRHVLNLVLFAVLTEEGVHCLGPLGEVERRKLEGRRKELLAVDGFSPVVVDARSTSEGPLSLIGIVTVHDGPSMPPGDRLAAEVAAHDGYQDVEAFLKAGGHRGRQAGALGRGVYFINRWFATVELLPGERVPERRLPRVGC